VSFRSHFFACLFWLLWMLGSSQAAGAAEQVKRLALVWSGAPTTELEGASTFWTRLDELGWTEGKNIAFAKYFANGDINRMPTLMAEALRGNPDLIVAPGSQAALAAKRATAAVPILSIMGDPVGSGLVASLARPGGNLTGVSSQNVEELPNKWVELLRELQPRLSRVAMIVNPDNPASPTMITAVTRATSALGITLVVLEARRLEDFPPVIDQARKRTQAVIVMPDATAFEARQLIAAQTEKHRLPAVYGSTVFVDAGGLISYGPDYPALWRRLGDYADKILKGAVAAEMPIEQPTTFNLGVNLKAARAIGVTVPQSLLTRADKVIQ
jgi:putative ABC transport system substrate-binding protein